MPGHPSVLVTPGEQSFAGVDLVIFNRFRDLGIEPVTVGTGSALDRGPFYSNGGSPAGVQAAEVYERAARTCLKSPAVLGLVVWNTLNQPMVSGIVTGSFRNAVDLPRVRLLRHAVRNQKSIAVRSMPSWYAPPIEAPSDTDPEAWAIQNPQQPPTSVGRILTALGALDPPLLEGNIFKLRELWGLSKLRELPYPPSGQELRDITHNEGQ